MMVTAISLSMMQANAKVEETADSRVQEQLLTQDSQSVDILAEKIKELTGDLDHEQADPMGLVANNDSDQSNENIYALINDIESKADDITVKNDRLSTYEEEFQARRLAESQLAKKFVAKSQYTLQKIGSSSKALSRNSAPMIAAKRASRSAHSRSQGRCAMYVRKALQVAGYSFTPNASAYQYATRGTLRKAGFTKISNNSKPQVGDIVVINRSRRHPHGHIAIYDGSNWVSDFRQKSKSPYSQSYPYTTWRDSRYLNNASSRGLYMANR